ncbi:20S proteasome subunit A/B [Halobacteriales archaeon QH_2_66_30]|nr:MAG: 20S proteasome subunit A/B [Halobacteriales archaeon QH_2_66_30]PSP59587.1 MAG: 20S proteasome subunit A/B [Halobacteriales archaeon QH_7_66_37]
MGLVVALESEPGVAIAGDARVTEDGTVRSEERRRVFDFGTVGVGAVGDGGALDQFQHRFGTALRSREFEVEQGPDIEGVARIAARQAEHASVDAAVAARDADGTPRLREVGAAGEILDGPAVALGGGTAPALGRLESVSPTGIDDLVAAVRDVVGTVAQRDADVGGDVEVWTLPADAGGT